MLDQNTDRMWYVIGAVIIGAAIIFIMNGTFPQLFASVGETFGKKSEDASSHLLYDGSNLLEYAEMSSTPAYGGKIVDFDDSTGTWTIDIPANADLWSNGLRADTNAAIIPYGLAYTLSYDVWSPIDTHSKNDIDVFAVNGVGSWNNNDNDDTSRRVFSDTIVPAGEWTQQWLTFYNTSKLNTERVSIYDRTEFGVVNPSSSPIQIKIRNVKGELGEACTPYRKAYADM